MVLRHEGKVTVAAAHLLQHSSQFIQVSVGEVLGLPQVQDHARRTGLGGKVVQVPGKVRRSKKKERKKKRIETEKYRQPGSVRRCCAAASCRQRSRQPKHDA